MDKDRRFFQTDNKTYWCGTPDVERGESYRLQFEKRKTSDQPYLYLHLGEVGRHGAPWGTLFLEVSGAVYHFRADERRLCVKDGSLTEEGKSQVVAGTSGILDCEIAWKWVQESVEISKLLSKPKMVRLKEELEHLLQHQAELPHYQAYQYALMRGVVADPAMHNCASFVACCLAIEVPIEIARMPVPLFDHIKNLTSH